MDLNNSKPIISIIIPCYNGGRYIANCLESIIDQTYLNYEIICVNDGSTDNTLSIMQMFAELDSRISIINQENKGISSARNAGLNNASGTFIMFVDGDDWLEKETISVLFEEYQDEDLIVFSYTREFTSMSLPKDLPLEGIYSAEYVQRRLVGPVDEEKKYMNSIDSFAPVWGKVYKKSILPDNVGFKELSEIGTWEDGFYNVEILQGCKNVLVVNKPLYHYRKSNTTSFTSLYKPDLSQKWNTKFKLLIIFLKDHRKNDSFFIALNNRVCLTFLGLCLNEINSGAGFWVIQKKIAQLLKIDLYVKSFADFDLKFLPFHWKLFYYFAKVRFSLGITALAILIHFIINRKNP